MEGISSVQEDDTTVKESLRLNTIMEMCEIWKTLQNYVENITQIRLQ